MPPELLAANAGTGDDWPAFYKECEEADRREAAAKAKARAVSSGPRIPPGAPKKRRALGKEMRGLKKTKKRLLTSCQRRVRQAEAFQRHVERIRKKVRTRHEFEVIT